MAWNKLKQTGAQVADSAVRTAGTLYEKGKKEARLMALDAKLGRAQRELGALVYSLRRTGEENEAFIEGLCEDIAAIEAKIAGLRAGGAQQPQAQPAAASSVKCCPQCGAELLERVSRKGRKFYGCERYPECDFVSWDRPVKEKCPVCGGRMVQKRGAKDTLYHVCVNETCRHRVQVETGGQDDAE